MRAKFAALLVGLFTIGVGAVGLASPDGGTALRRLYFSTTAGLYAAGAIRVMMGLVLFFSAPASRAPKTLRALGAVMCVQALAATIMGPERARAVLEWETMQGHAILRIGAMVALLAGAFMVFAVVPRREKSG